MPNALGTDRRTARTNADALFDALASRFDSVERAPKFFQARSKLGRYALSPSGVYRDTSVWTTVGLDSTRTLTLSGARTPTGYLFAPRPDVPLPNSTGASRHVIRLKRRSEDVYDWETRVDHAIGPVSSSEIASALSVFIASPERDRESVLRLESRTLFPRTTRVLGELFSIDTIDASPRADGSTSVLVRFRMDPQRIEKTRPNFSKYLDKYVTPARYRLRLLDAGGAMWLDASASDNLFSIAYRVRDGKLVTLAGQPRPIPDSLKIAVDFSAKFMIFRVGVSSLVGDFAFIRSSDERGWMTRFRKEPDWHFPLAVNTLIRTSLRHPFAGDGMTVRLSIRDRDGAQSLLSRQAGVSVQESAIVRWIGGLGNSAMSDFAGRAEAEENRYVYEVLTALRGDFVAALSGGE